MPFFKALNRAISGTRPLGTSLIVAFLGFLGGFYLFMMLASLVFFNLLSAITPVVFSFQVPSPQLFNIANTRPMNITILQAPNFNASIQIILYFSVLAFLYLVLARGLHLNRWWAYWRTIILELVNIFSALATSRNPLQFFTSLYLPLLILIYLAFLVGMRKISFPRPLSTRRTRPLS
jgi:hypothetical protein